MTVPERDRIFAVMPTHRKVCVHVRFFVKYTTPRGEPNAPQLRLPRGDQPVAPHGLFCVRMGAIEYIPLGPPAAVRV